MSFLGSYLAKALSNKASDIHMSEGEPVRIRVDGTIRLLENEKPNMVEIFDEIFDLCNEDVRKRAKSEFEMLNDVSVSLSTSNGVRLRATLYRSEKGLCAAMRIVPINPPSAESINLPKTVVDICEFNRGLFIVTGATGSGKSTTLACMIDYINKNRRGHIITLDDPIEYLLDSDKSIVSHREIGRHIQSFSSGLRSILREDPNVVVIGELRDVESMRAAMQIAETGHLVLTTLHTRSASSTIDRIIGMFPSEDQQQVRIMLADNLIGVLAQTLIPKREGGRIAAFELMLNNDAIKNNIREAKIYQIENILQTGSRHGMICMEDYIIELIRKGIIDYDTALAYAPSKAKFEAKAKNEFLR